MYPSLKDGSIACNLNQKQHVMFMLAGAYCSTHMIFYTYKTFFARLVGDEGTSKSHVTCALLTLTSSWQQPNLLMVVAQMGIVAVNVEG
jgi:hypothetical protein